ncbi:response regulator transcription factor [Psychroserpens sp. MEBiC05023]
MENHKEPKVLSLWKSTNQVKQLNNSSDFSELINKMTFLLSLGPFYYFVMNMAEFKIEFVSDGVLDVLGVKPEALDLETLFSLYHPEDFQKLHEKEEIIGDFLYNEATINGAFAFKAVYLKRLRHSMGKYKTILHQAMALNVSKDSKMQQALVIHTDVTHLNIPVDHKVSILAFDGGPSYYAMKKGEYINLNEPKNQTRFTKREMEIIRKMSEGFDFNEIANLLHISPHTVRAHKRNILKKSGCKNSAELITKCVREGMI